MGKFPVIVQLPALILLFCATIRSQEEISTTFDLANPIVFHGWTPRGPVGGHFGWSTALVNIHTGQGGTASWIFIGDPKANVTRDPSYNAHRVEEPGVVWRCTLFPSRHGGSELRTPDCETLNIDPIKGADCGARCPMGSPHLEYHSHNWVGGNIVSSESRLVISAHHWYRGGEKDPVVNGLAYWFDPQYMFTGNNQLNIGDNLSHRLIPFFYPATPVDSLPFQFYSQQHGGTLLPNLAHGEAGISLHLTKDGQLLMGAPGVQVWRGAVVRYQDSTRDGRDSLRINRYGKTDFDGYRVAKRYQSIANEYFGYAVTSGNFIRRQFDQADSSSFVGGAPRARGLIGQVVIFQLSRQHTEGIDEQVVLEGDQFGSYFGSALTSVDVNSDGLDELLIGAPSYNELVTTTSEKFTDHGTVFLYSSALTVSRVGGIVSSKNLVRITSGIGNKRGGRFGSAIVNLGDINEDGFGDFAIGAPYEEEEGGGGAVYVYHGKEKLETEWKPIMRVLSSTLSLDLRGLGCSFSTPVDIDHNYTPDLAIGSLTSESVLILRTRPVLDFETSVTYYAAGQNSRNPIRQLRANVQTFQIETCVRLKGKALAATKTKLRLDVTLSMDERQTKPRFSFVNEQTGNRATFQLEADALTLACRTLQAKADVLLNEKSASIDPIYFEQLIKYHGKSNKENTPLLFEIQSPAGKVKVVGGRDLFDPMAPFPFGKLVIPEELNINSDCRDPSHCVPDLGIEAWWADDTISGNSQKIREVDLNWRKRLGIHVKLSNRGEPAYSAEVTFVFKSSTVPKPRGIDFQLTTADCQLLSDREGKMRRDYTFIFTCTLKKPLRTEEPTELVVPVSLLDLYARAEMDELVLDISVQPRNDPSFKKEYKDLILSLKANVAVKLIGSVTPPTEPVSVHSPFAQQYEVILTGTTPVDSLYFKFRFPRSTEKESLLRIKTPTGIECVGSFADFSKEEPDSTDPSMSGNSYASRRRREAEAPFKSRLPIVERMHESDNMTLLGCGDWDDVTPSTDCMDVTCNMYSVHPNTQIELIRFDMIMNSSEAVGVLKEKRFLLLESLGSVNIFKESKPEHKGMSFAQTIVQFNEVSIQGQSWFLYVASGIGGLLLLMLIMFGLYKLGFFKRATKEQLIERKAEVAEQDATRRASMLENPNHEQLQQSNVLED